MARLIPCPHCFRHVRVATMECPFCEGAINNSASQSHANSRSEAGPSGVKRATLFALSATVAAACGATTESATDTPTSTADTSSVTTATTTSETRSSGGSSTDESTDDTSTTDFLPMPEYGAVPAPTSDETTSTLGPDASAPAADAGRADAGPDAGELSVPPAEPDPIVNPIAIYGAPPAP